MKAPTRLLLDTHTILYALGQPERLGAAARAAYLSQAELYFSIASLWEMAIKCSLGKLTLPVTLKTLAEHHLIDQGIRCLPLSIPHLMEVQQLPFHHRDPFDRLLIATARAEKLSIASADAAFDAYGVERIWE